MLLLSCVLIILDELLADLHSATNYIKNEQQSFAPTPGSNLSSLSTSALDGHNPKHYVGDTPHHQFYSNDQQLSSQRFSPKGKVNTASVSNRNSDRYSASSNGSGDMPAPPLPPPPSRDVIEEANMGYSSEVFIYLPICVVYNVLATHDYKIFW